MTKISPAKANAVTKSNQNVTSLVDNAISKYDYWHGNSRNSSRMDLYEVLASCLELYGTVKDQRKLAALAIELTQRGIKYQKGTSLATRIVRLVFHDDKRGYSRYASIVKIAYDQKIATEDFVRWLNQHGGIDATRKHYSVVSTAIPNDVLYDEALNNLQASNAIATVSGNMIGNVSIGNTDGLIVTLARVTSNGDYEIVGASSKTTVLRHAMIDWGRFVMTTNKMVKKTNTVARNTAKLGASLQAKVLKQAKIAA